MLNGISLALATVMERGRQRTQRQQQTDAGQQDAFGQQLFEALQSSIEKLGATGRGVQITISEGQDSATGAAGSRQFVITLEDAGASSSSRSATAAATTPAATTTVTKAASAGDSNGAAPPPIGLTYGSVKDLENPIPQLTAILESMGVSTSGISFELVDEMAIGLGGPGHTNHYIRTVLPNGMKEDFSVEWTLRNPKVTAVEIAGLMRRGNSWNPVAVS